MSCIEVITRRCLGDAIMAEPKAGSYQGRAGKKKRRREKEKAEREKKNGVFINLKKQLDIVLNCCKEK